MNSQLRCVAYAGFRATAKPIRMGRSKVILVDSQASCARFSASCSDASRERLLRYGAGGNESLNDPNFQHIRRRTLAEVVTCSGCRIRDFGEIGALQDL